MEVKIISTKGTSGVTIDVGEARTWGEIEPILNQSGVDTGGMKAIIGENKTSLECATAQFPLMEKVTVFLQPQKVRNGWEL